MPLFPSKSLKIPFTDSITESAGLITRPWQQFFSLLKELVDPLGAEKYFGLENNQSSPADITGMSVSSSQVSQAVVEYLIQRVTTASGAVELIAAGMFHLVYKPTTDAWAIQAIGTPGPSTSGITFSVTSSGQVQYTSTNEGGTPSISKIYFRIRTLGGKNYQYSTMGGR